ncbi:MAG: amidophosphoribosyltransferase [Fimbriimonadaceae bacterium]
MTAHPDPDTDRPKEECGVLGVFSPDQEAARVAFFCLFALQHRGQESAGIAVGDGSRVRMHKDMGLVSQVFNEDILKTLPGHLAIGHTRYSTMGASVLRNAQPVYCTSQIGDIGVAHNGNLINTRRLRKELEDEGEHMDSTSDSELIARLIVRGLHLGPEHAVASAMRLLEGAYSCTVITPSMVIGFRDPYGIRPLVAGHFGNPLSTMSVRGEGAGGGENPVVAGGFLIASESCAFGPVNGVVDHELEPGEMVIIDRDGMRYAQGAPSPQKAMCLFEFIYFARPDSRMYGSLLYGVRERMGEQLARDHPVEADIVVPVPDSGIPAALGYSRVSGIPYREGMTKSRYIHRTFIQPDQTMRELGVRMKLTPLDEHIFGQRIVLVDDSIVRATTTKQIVKLLFEAGAAEVHVRITAPPIKWPCFYGIDMASKGELAAAVMSIPEICKHIGATSLGYLSILGATEAVASPLSLPMAEGIHGEGQFPGFCTACFSGEYPIPVPEELAKHAFDSPPDTGQMAAVTKAQPAFELD